MKCYNLPDETPSSNMYFYICVWKGCLTHHLLKSSKEIFKGDKPSRIKILWIRNIDVKALPHINGLNILRLFHVLGVPISGKWNETWLFSLERVWRVVSQVTERVKM